MAAIVVESGMVVGIEAPVREPQELLTLFEARYWAEEDCIRRALVATRGNVTHAAIIVGRSRPTLHGLMKDHGLTRQMFQPSDASPAEA